MNHDYQGTYEKVKSYDYGKKVQEIKEYDYRGAVDKGIEGVKTYDYSTKAQEMLASIKDALLKSKEDQGAVDAPVEEKKSARKSATSSSIQREGGAEADSQDDGDFLELNDLSYDLQQ